MFYCRILWITAVIDCQTIEPIKNTVGLYYENEGTVKISNDQWSLVVYKDLSLISNAYYNNERILSNLYISLYSLPENSTPEIKEFSLRIRPHYIHLKQISRRIKLRLQTIQMMTSSEKLRKRRGLVDGLGTAFKWLTGTLDAADGEHINKCLDQLESDDKKVQDLLKQQIQIVTSTIKNFNYSINSLFLHETSINAYISDIQEAVNENQDKIKLNANELLLLELCEILIEAYQVIENEIRDVEDSISFSKLNILHPSIIQPSELLNQLHIISQNLKHSVLPMQATANTLPSLINIINLNAFQTEKRLVFVLQIPLVSNDIFNFYHLYSLPTKNLNNDLFHLIIPESKYVGISTDNRLYIPMHKIDNCKTISHSQRICKDVIPLSLNDPNCETEVITQVSTKKCKPVQIGFSDYNIIKLKLNRYILIVSKAIPVVTNCQGQASKTQLIEKNSLLYLNPRCSAFIGSTQLYAYDAKSSNATADDIIPVVPYDCCEDTKQDETHHLNLKEVHIKNLNMDDLNMAAEQLKNQEKIIDSMSKQTFAGRYLSATAICSIVSIILIALFCCCLKCKKKFRKCIEFPQDKDKSSLCVNIFNNCRTNRSVSRQESINSHELREYNSTTETVNPIRRSQRLQRL